MARRGDGVLLKGRSFYLDCRIGGKRYQQRLGKGISRKIACELASVVRGQILQGAAGIGKKAKDLTFAEARKRFEDWMISEKKPNTCRSYSACLRQVDKTFGSMRLSQITTWQLDLYKQKRSGGVTLTERPADLSDANWARLRRLALLGAPIRVRRELAVMKVLFNKMIAWGLFEGLNPACQVKFKQEEKTRFRFLEAEETDRLLSACSEPLKTLVLVGINCGLRIQAEALQLRWEDVDLRRGLLTVQAAYAKNGKMRSVPLNSIVRAALEQLQRTAKGSLVFSRSDGQPFRSVKTTFRTACRKAGIIGVTPHTLRHSFASRLVMSGADIRTVMELGGWSSLEMVQRYSHLSQGHKAEAVERMIGGEFTYGIPYSEKSTLASVS